MNTPATPHGVPCTEEVAEYLNHRTSRVINRDYVKRWALDYCASHTLFSKKNKVRVSEQFLNMIEAATKSAIIHRIESCQPSAKAKTLQ